MDDKPLKKKPYTIPDLRKNYYQDPEVVVLCYYLKTLGVSQNLNTGDVYYIKNEQGLPRVQVYNKDECENSWDFEFLTSGNYFRMITQEEALSLIKFCGYNHDTVGGITVSDNGQTSLSFVSPTLSTSISVIGNNIQSAYLKSAYMIAANNKMLADANDKIDEEGFFKKCKKGFDYGN